MKPPSPWPSLTCPGLTPLQQGAPRAEGPTSLEPEEWDLEGRNGGEKSTVGSGGGQEEAGIPRRKRFFFLLTGRS